MSITLYQAPANISQFIDTQFIVPAYCPALKATLTTVEEAASAFYNHPVTQTIGKTVFGAIGTALSWADRKMRDHTGISLEGGVQIGAILHGRVSMVVSALLATALLAQAFFEQPVAMTQNMAIAGAQMAGHAIRQIPSVLLQAIKGAPKFIAITVPVYIATTAFEIFVKFPLYSVPKFLFHHPVIGIPVTAGAAYAGAKAIYSANCKGKSLIESMEFIDSFVFSIIENDPKSDKEYVQNMLKHIHEQTDDPLFNSQKINALKYLIAHSETQTEAISKEDFLHICIDLSFLYKAKLLKYDAILNSILKDASSDEQTKQYIRQTLLLIDSVPAESIEEAKLNLINWAKTNKAEYTSFLASYDSEAAEMYPETIYWIKEKLKKSDSVLQFLEKSSNKQVDT